jgi:hypothetical protein
MSVANFYLGELERADYYEKRATAGYLENDNSVMKRASVKKIVKKRTRLTDKDNNALDDS